MCVRLVLDTVLPCQCYIPGGNIPVANGVQTSVLSAVSVAEAKVAAAIIDEMHTRLRCPFVAWCGGDC